jgi:hypothetical protein
MGSALMLPCLSVKDAAYGGLDRQGSDSFKDKMYLTGLRGRSFDDKPGGFAVLSQRRKCHCMNYQF